MPIPLKEKVKNYDNSLTGKLINFVENPDSLGYADGRWYSPKYDRRYKLGAFDPFNFGIGVDRNSNEYVDNGELMFHKDSKGREYLTEAEERNVRNHSIANAEKSYAKRLSHAQETLHSNNIPSEIKKAITISAIYNLGQGYVANNLFEDNVLMDAFLNGSDLEYSNQVNRYYEKKRKGDRGIKTNRFIEQLQQEPVTIPNTIQGGGIRAEGGNLNSPKLWDDLSMTERAEMMRVAVNNGITDLPTIRQKYDEFAEGGPKRDYNTWKKLIHDYKGLDVDNDKTYDYLSYYNNHTDEAWDMLNNAPDAHFYDTYKTAHHPTFSNESIYSGKYDRLHNSRGIVGGRWLENPNRFIPSPSKRDIDSIRETANYISVAEPNGLQIRDEQGRWPVIDGVVFGGVLPQVDISPKVYSNGGKIHIKPENRGKFTALKERTGHSATWFKQHGTPAQRKMATFALNSRKWKHPDGGPLVVDDYTYYGGNLPAVTVSAPALPAYQDQFTGQWYGIGPGGRKVKKPVGFNPSGARVYTSPEAFEKARLNRAYADDLNHYGEFGDMVRKGVTALTVTPMAGPLVEAATAAGEATYAGYKALPWIVQQVLSKGAQATFAAQGLSNFFGPEGYTKTSQALREGRYGDAALSAAGDMLDVSMVAPVLSAVPEVFKTAQPVVNKVSSFLNSPLTGKWTTVGNRQYRLSPNSLGSGAVPIEQRGLHSFTSGELDTAYRTAINNGDRKTALQLLDEAYKRSGIPTTNVTMDASGNPIVWYHGSKYGNHTIFDSSKMNATIGGESAAGKVKGNFLTTDLPSATRYAGSDMEEVKGFTEPTTFLEKLQNLFGKYTPQRIHPSDRIPKGLRLKPNRLFTTKNTPVGSYLEETDNDVYPFYVNPGESVYSVDFRGNPWSKSPVEFPNAFSVQKTIRDDVNRTYRDETIPFITREAAVDYYNSLQDRFGKAWVESPSKLNEKYFYYSGGDRSVEMYSSAPTYEKAKLIETHVPNTTNGAVQTAAREGYSSVHIPNVIDSNVKGGETPYAIDDLVTLGSNQMKIADITYDDSGNVIPLSKRFDWNNPDTRFLVGKDINGKLYELPVRTMRGGIVKANGEIMSDEELIDNWKRSLDFYKMRLRNKGLQQRGNSVVTSRDDIIKSLSYTFPGTPIKDIEAYVQRTGGGFAFPDDKIGFVDIKLNTKGKYRRGAVNNTKIHEDSHLMRTIKEGNNMEAINWSNLKLKEDEAAARGTQIKSMLGIIDDTPITGEELKYMKDNFVRLTGMDNNMQLFLNSITDFDEAAGWLSRNSFAEGGIMNLTVYPKFNGKETRGF